MSYDQFMKIYLFNFVCILQYNLDFRGLSPRGRSPGQRGDGDDNGGAGGASEGGKASGVAGGDPSI